MVFMSEWFDVIRWVGALYLVYLGARQLWLLRRRAAGLPPCRRRRPAPSLPAGRAGQPVQPQGAAVPRRLPAAVPRSGAPTRSRQLSILAVLFVAVLAAVDVGYTLAVAKARTTFDAARLRLLDGAAGVLLLLGGLALAMARRP